MTNRLDAHVVVPAGWTKQSLPVAEGTAMIEAVELRREKDDAVVRIGLFEVDGKSWLQYAVAPGDAPIGKNLLAKMVKQICPKAAWRGVSTAQKGENGVPMNGIAWLVV